MHRGVSQVQTNVACRFRISFGIVYDLMGSRIMERVAPQLSEVSVWSRYHHIALHNEVGAYHKYVTWVSPGPAGASEQPTAPLTSKYVQ